MKEILRCAQNDNAVSQSNKTSEVSTFQPAMPDHQLLIDQQARLARQLKPSEVLRGGTPSRANALKVRSILLRLSLDTESNHTCHQTGQNVHCLVTVAALYAQRPVQLIDLLKCLLPTLHEVLRD
jgi:hypothetical protein